MPGAVPAGTREGCGPLEIELARLLNGQIGGVRAAEDAVDI
jgi:hypothetical protein